MRSCLLLLVLTAGCACTPTPPPSPPAPVVDAAPPPVVDSAPPPEAAPACTTVCCKSCAVLASHACPEASPTPSGQSCEAVCLAGNASGLVTFPDVSGCTTLSCVQKLVQCTGGR